MFGVAPTLLLFLFATCSTVSAQYTIPPGTIRQPIAIGSLVVASVFSFLYLLQLIHCSVAIITMRGHRWPYIMLFTAIAFTSIASLTMISYTVALANITSLGLRASRAALFLFFHNWSLVFIFIAITAFLWDRETMIRTKSSGASGKQTVALVVVPLVLVFFMFIFATAQASASANWRLTAINEVPGRNPWVIAQRANTANDLAYTFYAFVIVSAIDVVVAAILLSRAARKASIPDKITNAMLFAVSPLYALLNITHFVFLIVLSPSGLLKGSVTFSKVNTVRRADLAHQVIEDTLVFLIFAALLFLSFSRASWDFGGALPTSTEQGQQSPQVAQTNLQQPHASQPPGMKATPAQSSAQDLAET